MSRFALLHGGVLEHLRTLPSNSADALLCDPPYGLRFMGKKWDYSVPSVEAWAEALRVLKPGAPLLAFGGSRTYHRMTVAIEDAGFEIRDCLMWLYGSGFPKSQSIDKAIDAAAGAERTVTGEPTKGGQGQGNALGKITRPAPSSAATPLARQWSGYGTALKPAFEPIILARKPLEGTMAANVAKWGVGGLDIDGGRIGTSETLGRTNNGKDTYDPTSFCMASKERTTFDRSDSAGGRWPANVLLDEEAAAALDAQSGNRPGMSGGGKHLATYEGGMFGKVDSKPEQVRGDQGGASRFFYTAKVSKAERELGCGALPLRSAGEMVERKDGAAGALNPRAGASPDGGARNHHPTLKPISLIKYLAGLILPPTASPILLVPYSGSGSEIIGALQAGWPAVIGIEREEEYVTIARARIPAHVPGAEVTR